VKILIASDSFKGTLSSKEVASSLSKAIYKKDSNTQIEVLPIADGGEGLVECFKEIIPHKEVTAKVTGPNFNKLNAKYILSLDNQTAVIEMASCAGLPLANPKSAKDTTTYGVGELINHAKSLGAKHIILGIGGSATNDAGCGMAAALGTKFINHNGDEFIPVGRTLNEIESIIFNKDDSISITTLCDVKNPMYGKNGAAFVFGKQKGATEQDIIDLDNNLKYLSDKLLSLGIKDFDKEGSGAAGGLGAGVLAFTNGTLKRGIDAILDAFDFEKKASNADYIITGEGALDSQSFQGKVIDGIISKSSNTPIIAVVGISNIDNPKEHGLTAVFETNYLHKPFEEIIPTCIKDLDICAEKVADFIFK